MDKAVSELQAAYDGLKKVQEETAGDSETTGTDGEEQKGEAAGKTDQDSGVGTDAGRAAKTGDTTPSAAGMLSVLAAGAVLLVIRRRAGRRN